MYCMPYKRLLIRAALARGVTHPDESGVANSGYASWPLCRLCGASAICTRIPSCVPLCDCLLERLTGVGRNERTDGVTRQLSVFVHAKLESMQSIANTAPDFVQSTAEGATQCSTGSCGHRHKGMFTPYIWGRDHVVWSRWAGCRPLVRWAGRWGKRRKTGWRRRRWTAWGQHGWWRVGWRCEFIKLVE